MGAAEHNGWLGRSKGPSGLAARGHLCEGIAPCEYSSFGAMHRLLEALSHSATQPLGHRERGGEFCAFAAGVRWSPITAERTVPSQLPSWCRCCDVKAAPSTSDGEYEITQVPLPVHDKHNAANAGKRTQQE